MYNVYSIILRRQGEGPIAYFCWILDIQRVHLFPALRARARGGIHLQTDSDAQQERQGQLSLLSWGRRKVLARYPERISGAVRGQSGSWRPAYWGLEHLPDLDQHPGQRLPRHHHTAT